LKPSPRSALPILLAALLTPVAVVDISSAETRRQASERNSTRTTVRAGEVSSSRREPSRIRKQDGLPTVQNRAPEIIGPGQLPAAAAGSSSAGSAPSSPSIGGN
jgi:hypothetical protein